MMEAFIIEHPRRGTLKELTAESASFSLTGARNDIEKTWIFATLREAQAAWEKIPSPLRFECNILIYNALRVEYMKLVRIG